MRKSRVRHFDENSANAQVEAPSATDFEKLQMMMM
jgi:hypothetical protein